MQRVVIASPSGVLESDQSVGIELLGAPQSDLELSCDGVSLDALLAALVSTGDASLQQTEFRTVMDAPAAALLSSCPRPVHLLAKMRSGASGSILEGGRVTYPDQPIPCSFEVDAPKTRVLLTGFEPFPALSSWDNSSEQAVGSFDANGLPTVSVMSAVLPVEWGSAAALVGDLIERCRPDLVIGFGEGRFLVEPETTAYNQNDASDIAGGVPDNRGIVPDGSLIVEGGPPQLATGLPAQRIADALLQAGVNAQTSNDPGRYVCNNLFYSIMHKVQGTGVKAGFVHLPVLYSVGQAQQQQLQTIVETVVRETLDGLPTPLARHGFEGGVALGWGLVSTSSSVSWGVSARRAAGGSYALYLGDPSRGDYDAQGNASRSTATMPTVTLPAGQPATLSFQLYIDTEPGSDYDTLKALVDGSPIWHKDGPGNEVLQKQWQTISIDLSSHQGQSPLIAFEFDTVDSINNSGEGVFIDEILLTSQQGSP
jgi:pyroglutamyl-peptidase